jgi:hypothetical protein
MFAGSAGTVIEQIQKHYDAVGGYGHLLAMGQAGFLEHDQTAAGIAVSATTSRRACERAFNKQPAPRRLGFSEFSLERPR